MMMVWKRNRYRGEYWRRRPGRLLELAVAAVTHRRAMQLAHERTARERCAEDRARGRTAQRPAS